MLTLACVMVHPSVTMPLQAPAPQATITLAISSATAVACGGPRNTGNPLSARPKRKRYHHSPSLAAIGVNNAWADAALGTATYEQLAYECSALLAFDPIYVRPLQKTKTAASNPETKFINPVVAEHLVPVVDNQLEHFLQALEKEPPQLRASQYSLPAACGRALDFMLEKGPSSPKWRL